MLDTSVSLPATLSPRGMTRKLWVLLALGAVTYEVEHRHLDLDELRREADASGGARGGIETARQLVEEAAARRAALLEHLPVGTPDDCAVGSRPLFDEYERKLRQIGGRFGIEPSDEQQVKRLRRQMEAICVAAAPPFDPRSAPALTRDPADDPIVLGALLGGADYLISDDKDIVPDRESQVYEHDDRRTLAVTFDYFVTNLIDDVEWDSIEGWLASEAFAPKTLEEDPW